MSALRALACLLLLNCVCVAQKLTIAAASDLQVAMPELVGAYEKKTGKKVRVVYGSSGNFFAQIQNGAPFDIFFSADMDYPKRLEAAGLTRPRTLYVYATGRIVVWVPNDSPLDLEREGPKALLSPEVKRIAIANPAHAPYGRAAKAALAKAGLLELLQGKLILGENVSQAMQFVHTGNAQAGILALSLALSPAMKAQGRYWLVPQELYPRLDQAAVILSGAMNPAAAVEFLTFLKGDTEQAVMKRFGFIPPSRKKERVTK